MNFFYSLVVVAFSLLIAVVNSNINILKLSINIAIVFLYWTFTNFSYLIKSIAFVKLLIKINLDLFIIITKFKIFNYFLEYIKKFLFIYLLL